MTHFLIISVWQITVAAAVIAGITVAALVDIVKSEFSGNNKIVWLLVVLLANFPGVILYFFIGRHQKVGVKD